MFTRLNLALLCVLGGTVFCAVALVAWADESCYLTVMTANKCGTDRELSWQMCGEEKCITEEVVYDNLSSCSSTTLGLSDCVAQNCPQITIERECEAIPGGYRCVETNQSSLPTPFNGLKAAGAFCNNPDE